MSEPEVSSETVTSPPESTKTGPGRLLVAVYGLFALSACARAGTQIATEFSRAPVAYVLSAFAGVVYIIATVTLVNGSRTARRIAALSCSVELAGVLAVGTWSVLDKASFPDATVWSTYGVGYGFVPLVLPVFGLLWLRRWSKRDRTASAVVPAAADMPHLRRQQDEHWQDGHEGPGHGEDGGRAEGGGGRAGNGGCDRSQGDAAKGVVGHDAR